MRNQLSPYRGFSITISCAGGPCLAVAVRPGLEAEDGADRRDVQPGPGAVQDPVEQGLHLRAGFKQQVAGVFGLVDRVAVAEPAALLLLKVQAEAQAGGVDPPVADLAQAPYSRITRPGICDPGQALRIRDLSKTVALLGEPDPLGVRGDRDVLVAVEDHLRPERRVPGHLDGQVPERRVHDVEAVVVDVLPFLLQAGDDPARRAVHLPHARRRLGRQDQEHPGRPPSSPPGTAPRSGACAARPCRRSPGPRSRPPRP